MPAQPTVINRHHYTNREFPKPWVYIGRGTPLGNPYRVDEHGDAALELYRKWLWEKLRAKDPAVTRALREITVSHHLVCSCKPRPCHGDIVVRAWQWLQDNQPQQQPLSLTNKDERS